MRLIRRDGTAIAAMGGKNFATTFITSAELHLGILKSAHPSIALTRTETVLLGRAVLYPSPETPIFYAEICHDLEQRGMRIPTNDIWMAAMAIEKEVLLIGRDEHFTRIDALDFLPC